MHNVKIIPIAQETIHEAMLHAKSVDFIDNLRYRNNFVQFDSKVRGYIGEIITKDHLVNSDVIVADINSIEESDLEDSDIIALNSLGDPVIIEVKTSQIPDVWPNLEQTINHADIKIIKREQNPEDIRADFYVQIYYNQLRKKRDGYLKSLSGNVRDYSLSELYSIMQYDTLRAAFIGWIDKGTLIEYLKQNTVKTWQFGFREFWKCPLVIAKNIDELPDSIKNYTK